MLRYLQNLLQLILAPAKGWEDIAASDRDNLHKLVYHYLYGSIGVAALSIFIQYYYNTDTYLPVVIVKGIVIFVSLFVTYYFSLGMAKTFLYKFCEDEPSETKYTLVITYSVGLLALSTIICNILPVDLGLQYILPLTVALIMWKADVYLRVKADKNFGFILYCLCTTILPPTIIQALFDNIL